MSKNPNKKNSHKRFINCDDDSEDDCITILKGRYFDKIECDEPKPKPKKIKYVELDVKAETLDDLINIGDKHTPKPNEKYNIDLSTIVALNPVLKKLRNMIGMNLLKQAIVDQIIYFLQDFESKNTHMMHTCIEGPPGCGKTEVANIMADIYAKMGFLKHNKVKKVRRSDLIGEYLGQTAIKTQKCINEAKGGILLIDEAYSLGNPEGRDIYSKECIDTLNQNLSEEKSEFICIIVGYKESLQKCFFNYNPGLERRFPFRFKVDEYDHNDLTKIFLKQIGEHNWEINIKNEQLIDFFEKNRKAFQFNGGDLETLFQCSKIAHSKRVFSKPNERKKLTIEDIENGYKLFSLNDSVKDRLQQDNDIIQHLYN